MNVDVNKIQHIDVARWMDMYRIQVQHNCDIEYCGTKEKYGSMDILFSI